MVRRPGSLLPWGCQGEAGTHQALEVSDLSHCPLPAQASDHTPR